LKPINNREHGGMEEKYCENVKKIIRICGFRIE